MRIYTRYKVSSAVFNRFHMLWSHITGSTQENEIWHFDRYSPFLKIFAGFPTTVVSGGTSFVTTDPAPTTAFSPMITPQRIVLLAPIVAPFLTRVLAKLPFLFALGCFTLVKTVCGPRNTPSSNSTPGQRKQNACILQLSPIIDPPISTNSAIRQFFPIVEL